LLIAIGTVREEIRKEGMEEKKISKYNSEKSSF